MLAWSLTAGTWIKVKMLSCSRVDMAPFEPSGWRT